MTDIVERLARVIADAMGDDYDDACEDKTSWIAERGMSGGRFRDCNEPFQSDYLAAAQAALEWTEAATEIERLRKHAEAVDLWCVMKQRDLSKQMEPYILRGATSDPKYHQLLGQHIAFGRMRSYLSGARRAEYPEEK